MHINGKYVNNIHIHMHIHIRIHIHYTICILITNIYNIQILGSHFTAFPCTGCSQCGDHTDPYFSMEVSDYIMKYYIMLYRIALIYYTTFYGIS